MFGKLVKFGEEQSSSPMAKARRQTEATSARKEGRKSKLSPIITGICLNNFCLIIPAVPQLRATEWWRAASTISRVSNEWLIKQTLQTDESTFDIRARTCACVCLPRWVRASCERDIKEYARRLTASVRRTSCANSIRHTERKCVLLCKLPTCEILRYQ